jgi:hypothetical protein
MAKTRTRATNGSASSSPTARWAQWRAVVAACQRSGLSQVEFCRRRGIAPGTLAFWKYTLKHAAAVGPRPPAAGAQPAPTAPAFLPVRVVPALASPPPSEPLAEAGAVEIVLATGRLVRVRGRVDPAWLGQLVRALDAAPC